MAPGNRGATVQAEVSAVVDQEQENLVRMNFHQDNESLINRQINLELYASYVYTAMAYHFDRWDVALKGHHKYFKKMASEEREHANKFMKYQNKRGGTIVLGDIKKPEKETWGSLLEAHQDALALEKGVYQALLELHATATQNNDPHLADYLEEEFLEEQVKSIKEYADYITNLRRVGTGVGEYIFDKKEFDYL